MEVSIEDNRMITVAIACKLRDGGGYGGHLDDNSGWLAGLIDEVSIEDNRMTTVACWLI